jgi:hypothetical protein
MSKHLRILRASGMVDELRVEADARIHLYQLRPEPFLALQAWLDQVQAYWRDQLIAFKTHAEQVVSEQPVSEQAEHDLTPVKRAMTRRRIVDERTVVDERHRDH